MERGTHLYGKKTGKIGKHLFIGIKGPCIENETVSHIRELGVSGVVLFSRNISSLAKIKKLITDLRNAMGASLLFAIDHEGSAVHRFKLIDPFPGNRALGIQPNNDYAYQQGICWAAELKKTGININFAPVLDVVFDRYNPSINIRSFGQDHIVASRLGVQLIKGMQQSGIAAVAKHFPGIGSAIVDGHYTMPFVNENEEVFRRNLIPFQEAVNVGVSAVMTSHIVFERRFNNNPVTFSKEAVTDLLRNEMGFSGIIFSDDLEMGATGQYSSIGASAVEAFNAGHDIVLSCKDYQKQREVYQALERAYRDGTVDRQHLTRSEKRIDQFIKDCQKTYSLPITFTHSKKILIRNISQSAVKISRDPLERIPVMSDTIVLYPDLNGIKDKVFFEKDVIDPEKYWTKYQNIIDFHRYSLISFNDYEAIENMVKKNEIVLFFTFNACAYPNEEELIKQMNERFNNVLYVCMADPIDKTLLRDDSTVICTHGFTRQQIMTAFKRIFGNKKKLEARG